MALQAITLILVKLKELGVSKVKDLSASTKVRLSAWGFPTEFRQNETRYRNDLLALPALAKTASELGVFRTSTWMMPCSDERTYRENFEYNYKRLKPAADILLHYGIRLGLEYVVMENLVDDKTLSLYSHYEGNA